MSTEQDDMQEIASWDGDDDKFAMQVTDAAMIGEHIQDGDYVIIDKRGSIDNGDVVAFLDVDGEARLRYFRRVDGEVLLMPSDGADEFKVIRRETVEILGLLVGVVRKY